MVPRQIVLCNFCDLPLMSVLVIGRQQGFVNIFCLVTGLQLLCFLTYVGFVFECLKLLCYISALVPVNSLYLFMASTMSTLMCHFVF